MTAPSFAPATRRAVKLKVAVEGPSGAGKTLGALALAQGLAEGGRIAVIDTENGSASLYADRYQFDTLELGPPYLTTKYQEAVQAAIDAGYAALVIDNISHQWEGDGSVLQRKEETDARGGNHFSNWAPFTKEHNAFRALLLNAPMHVVATMRSKMAYTQEADGKKTKIVKVGLQPIQREGMEYEFTLAFDVQMDHRALASKDRTGLFAGELVDLLDAKVAKRLLKWLKTAAPLAVSGEGEPAKPQPTGGRATKDAALAPSTTVVLEAATNEHVLLVFSEAAKAGLTKETFPAWYTEVTGRAWKAMAEQEVQLLLDAAVKKLTAKREKVTA